MNTRTIAAACGLALGTSAFALSATSASAAPDTYDEAITSYVAERDGVSKAEARDLLKKKDAKQDSLRTLEKTVDTRGSYFEGDQLVVVVADQASASKAKAAGLKAKVGAGQEALSARATSVLKSAGTNQASILSVTPDLASGTVAVEVTKDAPDSLVRALQARDGVTVSTGQTLTTQADVVPGQIMDLDPGTNCSLGFPGRDASGDNVLITAGHCVEGMPDVLNASGEHIGVGVASEFNSGSPSVDMGLMDIDAEDTGVAHVDSRGHSGNHPIRGASKAPVGTEICKAGNTTGWTCGEIEGYDVTVNYQGGTSVSGLARASVCTEGGDSGGAYISGDQAQGVTSGGPVGVDCGFNQGANAGSYSFYQPVIDAAEFYGVTIDTQ